MVTLQTTTYISFILIYGIKCLDLNYNHLKTTYSAVVDDFYYIPLRNRTFTDLDNHTLGLSDPVPIRVATLTLAILNAILEELPFEWTLFFQKFDILKFYRQLFKLGAIKSNKLFFRFCPHTCVEMMDFEEDTAEICNATCGNIFNFLEDIGIFFKPNSELFNIKLTSRYNPNKEDSIEFNISEDASETTAEKSDEFEDEIEDYDSSLDLDNEYIHFDNNYITYNDNINLIGKDSESKISIDEKTLVYTDDDPQEKISSRLLLLWDVDETLLSLGRRIQNNEILNRKFNTYTLSTLFLIKERQLYDPRIMNQYIVTHGINTISKLQHKSIRDICEACWDILRIYDRYFATEDDDISNQIFKRMFEAKEEAAIAYNNGDNSYTTRFLPGPLKNIFVPKLKDLSLLRNYIIENNEEFSEFKNNIDHSNQHNKSKEFFVYEINEEYNVDGIRNNLSYNKTLLTSLKGFSNLIVKEKQDNIVTVLIDDNAGHIRLACLEEVHQKNMLIIPIYPLNPELSIEENINISNLTDRHLTDILAPPISIGSYGMFHGLNLKYLPNLLNGILNDIPIDASADILSKELRLKVYGLFNTKYKGSLCSYDIDNPKSVYFVITSPCSFFEYTLNLMLKMSPDDPYIRDFFKTLSAIDAWIFNERPNKNYRDSCSSINSTLRDIICICNNESLESNTLDKKNIEKLCIINWNDKFYFGYDNPNGSVPLNSLLISTLPRRRTIILSLYSDLPLNVMPISTVFGYYNYCQLASNHFISHIELLKRLSQSINPVLNLRDLIDINEDNKYKELRNNNLKLAITLTKTWEKALINNFDSINEYTVTNSTIYMDNFNRSYVNCTTLNY
ncbi:uncharacterized protein CMU_038060 [Cryptosporidium muris RN66]|uniref:Uncharacterized protein n=1 Tax=Cryptosporidium muris (strain RN66) TaxID=441375 RepID=B6A950_CRYMR|nr:uncharacterized protein CMU_038060 [Cryptosporidium muris RN66]EEA04741.1 hypothetical protein, conserved [Cryptosporidium muris RN66]|eukprot:XP_002139090.1 hypothetical protein [Cryptosporidium muris RN66]